MQYTEDDLIYYENTNYQHAFDPIRQPPVPDVPYVVLPAHPIVGECIVSTDHTRYRTRSGKILVSNEPLDLSHYDQITSFHYDPKSGEIYINGEYHFPRRYRPKFAFARYVPDPETLITQWGPLPDSCMVRHDGVFSMIYRHAFNHYLWTDSEARGVLLRFNPAPSTTHHGQLAITPSHGAKRITGKPGRMLRKIFPGVPDREIENLQNKIRDAYLIDVSRYTYHKDTTAQSFKRAYSHQLAPSQQINTCSDRKNIYDSCMRYSFDSLPHHPAEAYASGDFEIHWLEDQENRIAARSVVHIGSQTRGPVYGVNEPAIDRLMDEIDLPRSWDHEWEGARLLYLPTSNSDRIIAPYLDVPIGGLEGPDGNNYLKMTIDESDYTTHEHCGTQSQIGPQCDGCGCHLPPDDLTSVENYGNYCEDCFSERFILCERSNVYVPRNRITTVLVTYASGLGFYREYWSEEEADMHATYCEHDGEYWDDEDILHDYDGNPFSTWHLRQGDFHLNPTDGLYYPDGHPALETNEEETQNA